MIVTPVPFFAVCRPKYTWLGDNFKDTLQFAAPFPIDDDLLRCEGIRDKVAKVCCRNQCFRSKIIIGEKIPNVWLGLGGAHSLVWGERQCDPIWQMKPLVLRRLVV